MIFLSYKFYLSGNFSYRVVCTPQALDQQAKQQKTCSNTDNDLDFQSRYLSHLALRQYASPQNSQATPSSRNLSLNNFRVSSSDAFSEIQKS